MAQIPQGYKDIPEEDRRKAQVFFDRGKTVADTGNFDYAIEMYLQGLTIDPENTEAHQSLREVSLKRKATGGKDLGMFAKMGLRKPTKEDKQNMLNAEKMLAYDPGNTDHMVTMLQNAHRAGYYDTVLWMGPILQKANADSKSPEFDKFIILKDVYKDLRQWKKATDACHYAAMLRPEDMDLQTELKNLGAQHTMDEGRYGTSGSFRDSVRDSDKQQRLMEQDKGVRSMDSLLRGIKEAEEEFNADPNEAGKLMKLVEALVKTEEAEHENRAIDLLTDAHERTKQFRFRQNIGRIRMIQLNRMERTLRQAAQAGDDAAKAEWKQFVRDKADEELREYQLWAENYPTDTNFKYQAAARLFQLERWDEAIPALQQVRLDPKFRVEAGILLGRAFLEAGFADEAADTLKAIMDEYQIKGDTRSKDMYYWYGRAVEQKGDPQTALKAYSQVTQWDFNYRDVQTRMKRLRSGAAAGGGGE